MSHKVFDQSQMVVEGRYLKVENHSISISHIVFIWAGRLPKRVMPHSVFYLLVVLTLFGIRFFNLMILLQAAVLFTILFVAIFIVPKRPTAVNIKLISDEIFSFIPKNEGFTFKVYDLMHEILCSDKADIKYKIDFRGDGEIIDLSVNQKNSEGIVTIHEVSEDEVVYSDNEVYEEYERKNSEITYDSNETIVEELEKLYSFYDDKKDKKEYLLELIRQTILLNKKNDKNNKKEIYEKFVQSGLIIECNEIGLNFLLDDIKNILY